MAERGDMPVTRGDAPACRPAESDRTTIYEKSSPGRRAYTLPELGVPEVPAADLVPEALRRSAPARLPEIGEIDLLRHFTGLSTLNYGVDSGSYPLGSCTMKYNPRVNEVAARLDGLSGLHPYQPESLVQGALELMHELEGWLAEISGLHVTTLQPAAGAHGELTGLLIIRAAHQAEGRDPKRIIIPDTAHGTNPASVVMGGFVPVPVSSDPRGGVDVDVLRTIINEGDIAGLMLTNPNTLGLFDENITEIARLVHEAGGLLYYDGANANAVLGVSRPGDMGFDIVHFNTHKTFSTPHGGGGPGAGPVGVSQRLEPYLPSPMPVLAEGDPEAVRDNAWAGRSTPGARFGLDHDRPQSIGRVRTAYGNFGMFVRAYTYIRSNGGDGLREVSDDAVLAANYLRVRLADAYDLPYDRICKHEVVFSGRRQKREHGVSTLDIAKAILDHDIHPPTIYFPLIVEEALMIEPTETESVETLDHFVDVMHEIAELAATDPDAIHRAPTRTPVGRLDEVTAARHPDLRHDFGAADGGA